MHTMTGQVLTAHMHHLTDLSHQLYKVNILDLVLQMRKLSLGSYTGLSI